MGKFIKSIQDINYGGLSIDNIFSALLDKLETDEQKDLLKTALKSLNSKLDFFKVLLDAVDESTIIAITDAGGKIIYANEKFIELSKYSLEELLGSTHAIVKSEYHDDDFFESMWKIITSGNIWQGEVKNKAKDGSYYWVKSTILPVMDEENNIEYYISIRTDITEGKLLKEQMLVALEEEYKQTMQVMDSLVFRIYKDEKNNFRYKIFEGKLAKDLGFNIENTKNSLVKDVIDPSSILFILQKYEAAFQGQNVSYKYELKDRFLLTNLTPHFRNGEVYEVIGITKDITSVIKAREKVYYMAYHDDLTKLPNQRKLNEVLKEIVFECSLNNRQMSLMYIDLDRFKVINDTLGYFIGDSILQNISSRLQDALGDNVTVYRVGGDDFVVIFNEQFDNGAIRDKCFKILENLESPFYIDMHEVFISATIGVAIFPEGGKTPNDLVKNASIALQLAKGKGRNQYQFFDEQMYDQYHASLKIEGKLKKAILEGNLDLHFQPKISLNEEKIVGFEALVRWNDNGENISPAQFIPIAEESGLITKLGEWVLFNSCKQIKNWLDQGYDPKRVSVNVSAIELQHPDFVGKVAGVLHETGLNPKYLEIEITENSLIKEMDQTITTLNNLRDIGVSIAIDDFGTGYSSFSYLQKFPINSLKIDQSFIKRMLEDESQEAIVRAMIYVGHSFKMKIVAEGVEDAETYKFLKTLKCDLIQGYFISKPKPAEIITEEFLKKCYKTPGV
ncbi:MAG: cph2 2 [Bacillales bacterium]|jgi:diguanylate cyclase (GGDEF)-like protein/PAS domain S-box-containing protein|nr:cph2 2 [Bacillales bacterium]